MNGILNSAQLLHMYNKNQICIQKLRNKKLDLNFNVIIKDPEIYIKEVIEPFNQLIKRKELKITVQNDIESKNTEMVSDWKIYQLILFHFIQNAVKYNQSQGQIFINYYLQEKQRKSLSSIIATQNLELVTKIKDTGNGIEQDRIQYMFVLFGELRKKQELQKVKDLGIGVGLSCSKELC